MVFFPVTDIFVKLKEEENLVYSINMYKQGHQQKWFFPCKHIFVKLKEEGNLIYIINIYKQGHQQKCFFPCKHIDFKISLWIEILQRQLRRFWPIVVLR